MNDSEFFPSEQPGKKDIQAILSIYFRQWRLFVIGVVVSLLLAILYLKVLSTPKYSVMSTMLIKDPGPLPNVAAVASFSGSRSADPLGSLYTTILLLKSKALMRRAVNDLALTTTYAVNDDEVYGNAVPIKAIVTKIDSAAYGEPFVIKIESGSTFTLTDHLGATTQAKFGQQIRKPYGTFTFLTTPAFAFKPELEEVTVTFNTIESTVDGFAENLSVGLATDKAAIIKVTLVDPFPRRAQDIIAKLLDLYSKDSFDNKSKVLDNTISFLDDRLNYFTSSLSSVEKRVEQYKRQNELTDVSSQASIYVGNAEAYNKNIADWALQIELLESVENYLTDNQNQYKLVPSTLGIQDGTLSSLIAKLNELQMERENLLRDLKPNNPLVKTLNEQLANLRSNILENLRNIKRGLVIQSNNYKANSEKFRSKVSKVPSIERDLLEINRQQSIRQNIYLYLLQKREETTIAKSALVADTQIIDAPRPDPSPVSPKLPIVLMIAFVAGLGIPFLYIFLKDFLNSKVQREGDIEEIIKVPVFEEIPHSKTEPVAVVPNQRNLIVERFELIRAKLLFNPSNEMNKVFMVTSAGSEDGKSFFSINFASSLLLANKKVVLLELDLREPSLRTKLRLNRTVGVTDYLTSDSLSIVDIIESSDSVPNLSVISAGSVLGAPAEVLMSPKLVHLINELRASFDYILIDAAAVGQVADAFAFKSFVDATLFLVRYNVTPKKSLASIDEMMKNGMLVNPLFFLNDVTVDKNEDYDSGKAVKKSKKKKAYN